MSLSILVVCTGNVCRSPLAEQLLAARFADAGFDATVYSAGTAALVGEPMPVQAVALSTRYGGVPGNHVGVQLTQQLVDAADLVLTASREHRAAVASMVPRAARRSYTLREFARIVQFLEQDPDGFVSLAEASSPLEIIGAVSTNRGFATRPNLAINDDVVDPFGRSSEVYEESGRVIEAAVTAIVRAFTAVSRTGRGDAA
ncbi:arsenate reductase/protein-tyrosine-phosphatase family protein [Agromyces albus]|uniref:arsenate reductase/protein-tyrosine-phosphatase family protein n=1 Tax=Agromyces albus TaxID=205332 RepID=UPI00277D5859|nr:low molecular weight phosphatase family protein [Agromyces albus]MDQ0574554.1 protein-tyrosine phosphatase [Agromyces albus]